MFHSSYWGRLPRAIVGVGFFLYGASSALAQAPIEVEAPAPERELTLGQLLIHAERYAPALRAVRQRRGYATAARADAGRTLRDNPTLELAAGPRFEGGTAGDVDFVAALSQPIEIGGERGRRVQAAEQLGAQLEADIQSRAWGVRLEVTRAYWAAVVARERVLVAQQLVQLADELRTVANRRLAAGEATAIEVRVAEVDLAEAERDVLEARQRLGAWRVRLAAASGHPVDAPPQVPVGLQRAGSVAPLARLLETARAQHPELRARRAAVSEARARVEVAEREAWPKPVIGVQLSREGSRLGQADTVVLATLAVPLPLWRTNEGERQRARTDEAVNRADAQSAAHQLDAEVVEAHAALVAAEARIQLFTTAVEPQLEDGLQLLQRGFDAGELPLLGVTAARERFVAARVRALDAYDDYYRAFAELEYAVGRPLDLEAPSTPKGSTP
jgi:outer membrane protein, heavy metal efflux system